VVSPSVDMLPFGVTIPATVTQSPEIPEGLMNYPVYVHLVGTFEELRGLVQSNPTQGTKNVTLVCVCARARVLCVCVCVCVCVLP
jgi:hypothetical protein